MPIGATCERPSAEALGRAVLLAAGLLFLSGAAQGATDPSGGCRAVPSGRAVAVHAQLDDLIPGELLRLISLGLAGNLHVEIDLVKRRPLWLPLRVARQTLDLVITRDARGDGFLLDGEQRLPDPARLRLPRILLPVEGDPAGLEAQLRVQLRVITPSSLGKMATWVAGGGGKEEERSALSAGLLSLIADELARSVEVSCAVARRSK